MQCQVREFCLHYGAGFSMTQDLSNISNYIFDTDEELKLQVVDKDNIFVPPGLDRPNLIGKAKKPEEKQQEKEKPKIHSVQCEDWQKMLTELAENGSLVRKTPRGMPEDPNSSNAGIRSGRNFIDELKQRQSVKPNDRGSDGANGKFGLESRRSQDRIRWRGPHFAGGECA